MVLDFILLLHIFGPLKVIVDSTSLLLFQLLELTLISEFSWSISLLSHVSRRMKALF